MSVATARPMGKPGGPGLFHTPGAELPPYVREIARAIMKSSGKTKSEAIQIAIGTVKRWAAEGKPKAVAALAQWEAAKAKAHATPNKADLSNPGPMSGMIALEVPAGTIPALPGGEPEDELHLTLAYLGDDVSDRDFAAAISRALTASQENQPVTGSVGGLGVFPPKDGKQAVWVTVDAPAISRVRDYVQSRQTGGDVHGFTPHITRVFQKEGAKLPAPLPQTPITFTHLIVKRGDQLFRFQLGGEYREWSNALDASGHREVLLAQAPEKAKKKDEKKPPPKGDGRGGQIQFKHGWIPVDSNGNATGPAQKPQWLKDAEAKHKAAGGKTAEQIQAEKAAGEFKRKADKAAAPAKKAAAEAKRKKAEAERNAKHKAAESARAKKKAEREKTSKQREKDALINKAYKQAIADRKAGRELSDTQRRVIAHVEKQNAKEQAKLRQVDVPGEDGSKVAARGPVKKAAAKKTASKTPAKKKLHKAKSWLGRMTSARPSGTATANTVNKSSTVVRAKSYTSGLQNHNRSRRQGGTVRLANPYAPEDDGGGVNAFTVVELAGGFPKGQLAFRYKHGWILINPAIPSRGRMGGGIAKQHGHKSGSVTHGHFEPGAGGKGKKFVPERSGGENNPAKLKAAHNKTGDKTKYGLTAAQKDSGNALKPSIPSAEKVSGVSKAANDASIAANKSKSVADAQVAAKKHADAFVQAKKAGNTALAESHKSNAQAWAKKAQQLKTAEKASADAKAKHTAEKALAEEKAKAELTSVLKEKGAKATELMVEANKKPGTNGAEMAAKSHQYNYAAKAYDDYIKTAEENGVKVSPLLKKKAEGAHNSAKEWADKAVAYKVKANAANKAGADAFDLTEATETGGTAVMHKMAAKEHADAAKMFSELGMQGDATMHAKQSLEHAKKAKALESEKTAPSAPKAETGPGPGMTKNTEAVSTKEAVDYALDGLDDDTLGSLAQWDDYLHASAIYKKNPTPANLKKLGEAQKALIGAGVQPDDLKVANKNLYKKLGYSVPAKKTVAQKKTVNKITAQGITPVTKITADVPKKPAKKTAAPKTPESDAVTPEMLKKWEVELPGPGMYKDGNTIMKLMNKPTSNPAEERAKEAAVEKALFQFHTKHGKPFDPNSVEIDYSMGHDPVPQLTTNFFDAAKAAGYTHPDGQTDVTNGWKPPTGTKAALLSYTGSGYTSINGQLRGSSPMSDSVRNKTKAMDKAFDDNPGVDKDIVAIRKMTTNGQFPGYPPPMTEGDEYVDYGYGSTSKSTSAWSGKVVMEVRIPKGTKVIDVNHNGVVSCSTSEQELILPRGARYRVVSDEMINGQRRITTEIVGVGATHPDVTL